MISTGCEKLNEFLQGFKPEVTLVYGPAASGKTTLALQTAIKQAEQGKRVLYLDTEGGFNSDRVKQINPNPKILDNIVLMRIKEFMEQRLTFRKLKNIVEKGKISLIVIDTIGMHYRLYLQKNSFGANMCLKKQYRIMNEIANELKIPVIVTNQVSSKMEGYGVKPTGGEITFRNCQKWIELQNEPKRRLLVRKPQPFKHTEIVIENRGLKILTPSNSDNYSKDL